MFKSVQQKLKDASILEENEPILSFVQVIDFNKQQQQFKKQVKEELSALLQNKVYYFLASIKTADNDSTPIIYLLKLNEKTNDFKLKATYYLDEIKTVTKIDNKIKHNSSSGSSVDVFAFELVFRSDSSDSLDENVDQKLKFVWQCNKIEDRNDFLDTLWKLSEQFLKVSSRPKFVNYKFEPKKSTGHTRNENDKEDDNSILNDLKQQYEITKSEEESLLKLMSECDFASSSAEKFIEKLQDELLKLDTSNIESIMNSEEKTLKLIDMLDGAVDEIEKIDERLKEYEDKISAVGDAVRLVGERDNVIQIQQNSQYALLELLESFVSNLDFPQEYRKTLIGCDLSNERSIKKVTLAANKLLEILEAEIPSGLKKMKAYTDQMLVLEKFKFSFCSNLCQHLKNAIGHATNKHLESYKIDDNSLKNIPNHKQIHDDLLCLKDLVPWVQRSNCSFSENSQKITFYDDLKNYYVDTTKQLYIREINAFSYCAKTRIVGSDRTKSNTSMENIRGSMIRSLDKTHHGESMGNKTEQENKKTLKMIFMKLMNQLTSTVLNEQVFCQEFFGNSKILKNEDSMSNSTKPMSRTNSNLSLTSNTSANKQEPKVDYSILREIFAGMIEDQVKQVMDGIVRADYLLVLFLYSDLLARVLVCHTNKEYMHQPMVGLLRFAKEKCEDFVKNFKDFINETKVNKKEKIGILKFVKYFEDFVQEAEACWEPIKKDSYEKLSNIYDGIVREIFKAIDEIASGSFKTPSEVVLFQNYHYMNHIMRSMSGLKELTKKARESYLHWQKEYVKKYFGRPLEKIHEFFEKVQAKIDRGLKHQDISYQLELSANNLREIIREYPAKEIKKGLSDLYNRVEKHLVENSSLLDVVWREMSHEFINQYKNYEHLIKMCYEGQSIKFEFTESDIYRIFNEISIEKSRDHKF